MANILPTGIAVLDRMIGGGIPAGSVVAITAKPASQSELILYELTAARPTLYLTTLRSRAAVAQALEEAQTRVGDPHIHDLGREAPLDHANQQIRTLPEGASLIIDPVDPLESGGSVRYSSFLSELQTHMTNTGSVAFLHAMEGRSVGEERDLTEYMADVVFRLETKVQGDTLENRLAVPKFRGGPAMDEPIKLELRDRVSIDTSRDIA